MGVDDLDKVKAWLLSHIPDCEGLIQDEYNILLSKLVRGERGFDYEPGK